MTNDTTNRPEGDLISREAMARSLDTLPDAGVYYHDDLRSSEPVVFRAAVNAALRALPAATDAGEVEAELRRALAQIESLDAECDRRHARIAELEAALTDAAMSEAQAFSAGYEAGEAAAPKGEPVADEQCATCCGNGEIITDWDGYLHPPEGAEADNGTADCPNCGEAGHKPAPASAEGEPVTLTYRNWRGEVAARTILPQRVWFGSTEWHPEPQWLLTALDVEKGESRDFALKDFGASGMPKGEPVVFTADPICASSVEGATPDPRKAGTVLRLDRATGYLIADAVKAAAVEITKEEFIDRFAAHCLKTCGFTHFDDGSSVEEYARETAEASWSDPHYREDGPEACAESDMEYWGEE